MARRSRTRRARRLLAAGTAALLAAAIVQVAVPRPAQAAVTRLHGFRATVDGFTSWYGSYGMGPLGTAWCIDHGSRAPDPAYGYAPTDLAGVDPGVRAALGWAVGNHGRGSDPIDHAALMLALHDLMGARYPSGRLDVDRLGPQRLAGFAGHEWAVLDRARAIKADSLAHAHLRGPLRLRLTASPLDRAGLAEVTARVEDSEGRGVPGVPVQLRGAGLDTTVPSGADGTTRARVQGGPRPVTVEARATVPRLPVDAWASTTVSAQRVARPIADVVSAQVRLGAAAGRLVLRKTGDAVAWLPVTGARFRVEPAAGGDAVATLTVGDEGEAPPVSLPPGRYRVIEEEAPAGYDLAGPWEVVVEHGQTAMLEVADRARRGGLRLRKVDAEAGAPLAGAELEVHYDADADGSFELLVDHLVTGEAPVVLDDLLPGRYRITETAAPAGYALLDAPVDAEVRPGELVDVWLLDQPLPAPTTTTAPPTTAPPTTAPTTAPPSTVATVAGVVVAPPPAPTAVPAASLPRTGADTLTLALAAAGLLLVGAAALSAAPAQPSAPAARRAAIRSSS